MRTAAKALTSARTTAIINCLRAFGHFAHRQNNHGWQNGKGQWINPHGVRGVPDITGCASNGRYLGVEVKTGNDKLSPFQEAYKAEVEKRGGYYLVAGTVDEIVDWQNREFEK